MSLYDDWLKTVEKIRDAESRVAVFKDLAKDGDDRLRKIKPIESLLKKLKPVERALRRKLADENAVRLKTGLSADGRTYFTPAGPIALTTKAAEIIAIMVEQWNNGVEDVAQAYINEMIGVADNEGDTRIRDRVGRQVYGQLITIGTTKGTLRLKHTPSK